MSLVKFVQGKEDNLPSIAETGAIYFTTDECIYLGLADGTYKVYGNFITVNTVDDLPETSNECVLFYIKEENALYKYDNENLVWVQVTVDTSTTYDIVNGEIKGSIVVTATNSDGEIVSQETIQVVDVEALETKITSATYDDTQIKADIKTNSDAIAIIVADYLKNADKEELQSNISDLDTRVQETENTIANLGALATMDEITEDVIPDSLIQKINESDANNHIHDNQSELNQIQVGDVNKWNAIESNVKQYTDGLNETMDTRVKAIEDDYLKEEDIVNKADKATTLAGYGITDAMTADEIAQAIKASEYDDTALIGRVTTLEAIDHDAYVGADIQVLTDAKVYADSLANNYDTAGSASVAEQNAKEYADKSVITYEIKNGKSDGSIILTGVNNNSVVSTKEIQVVKTTLNGTNISQFQNDIGYITKDIADLANYYKKTETYSQSEVDALVSVISTYDTEVVTSLPTENISETTIYLLVTDNGDGTSTVTSYVYDNNTWVIMTEQKQDIGDMSIHWGTF